MSPRYKIGPVWMGRIVALVGIVLVIAGGIFTVTGSNLQTTADQSEQKASISNDKAKQVKEAADPAADSILSLCQRTDEIGQTLQNDPTKPCDKAADVKDIQVPQTTTITEKLSPSDIRIALNDYFNDHPLPTPAQVIAEIDRLYRLNPPADGKNATVEEMAQVLDDFCSSGRCDGKKPSLAQLSAQVVAFCADHNGCVGPAGIEGPPGPTGPKGDTGAQGITGAKGNTGRGVLSFSDPHLATGQCVVTITYDAPPASDPNGPLTEDVKIPLIFCP